MWLTVVLSVFVAVASASPETCAAKEMSAAAISENCVGCALANGDQTQIQCLQACTPTEMEALFQIALLCAKAVAGADMDITVGGDPCTQGPSYFCANEANAKECSQDFAKCGGDITVGGDPCTYGPSYFCANEANAKECNQDFAKCDTTGSSSDSCYAKEMAAAAISKDCLACAMAGDEITDCKACTPADVHEIVQIGLKCEGDSTSGTDERDLCYLKEMAAAAISENCVGCAIANGDQTQTECLQACTETDQQALAQIALKCEGDSTSGPDESCADCVMKHIFTGCNPDILPRECSRTCLAAAKEACNADCTSPAAKACVEQCTLCIGSDDPSCQACESCNPFMSCVDVCASPAAKACVERCTKCIDSNCASCDESCNPFQLCAGSRPKPDLSDFFGSGGAPSNFDVINGILQGGDSTDVLAIFSDCSLQTKDGMCECAKNTFLKDTGISCRELFEDIIPTFVHKQTVEMCENTNVAPDKCRELIKAALENLPFVEDISTEEIEETNAKAVFEEALRGCVSTDNIAECKQQAYDKFEGTSKRDPILAQREIKIKTILSAIHGCQDNTACQAVLQKFGPASVEEALDFEAGNVMAECAEEKEMCLEEFQQFVSSKFPDLVDDSEIGGTIVEGIAMNVLEKYQDCVTSGKADCRAAAEEHIKKNGVDLDLGEVIDHAGSVLGKDLLMECLRDEMLDSEKCVTKAKAQFKLFEEDETNFAEDIVDAIEKDLGDVLKLCEKEVSKSACVSGARKEFEDVLTALKVQKDSDIGVQDALAKQAAAKVRNCLAAQKLVKDSEEKANCRPEKVTDVLKEGAAISAKERMDACLSAAVEEDEEVACKATAREFFADLTGDVKEFEQKLRDAKAEEHFNSAKACLESPETCVKKAEEWADLLQVENGALGQCEKKVRACDQDTGAITGCLQLCDDILGDVLDVADVANIKKKVAAKKSAEALADIKAQDGNLKDREAFKNAKEEFNKMFDEDVEDAEFTQILLDQCEADASENFLACTSESTLDADDCLDKMVSEELETGVCEEIVDTGDDSEKELALTKKRQKFTEIAADTVIKVKKECARTQEKSVCADAVREAAKKFGVNDDLEIVEQQGIIDELASARQRCKASLTECKQQAEDLFKKLNDETELDQEKFETVQRLGAAAAVKKAKNACKRSGKTKQECRDYVKDTYLSSGGKEGKEWADLKLGVLTNLQEAFRACTHDNEESLCTEKVKELIPDDLKADILDEDFQRWVKAAKKVVKLIKIDSFDIRVVLANAPEDLQGLAQKFLDKFLERKNNGKAIFVEDDTNKCTATKEEAEAVLRCRVKGHLEEIEKFDLEMEKADVRDEIANIALDVATTRRLRRLRTDGASAEGAQVTTVEEDPTTTTTTTTTTATTSDDDDTPSSGVVASVSVSTMAVSLLCSF